MGFIHAAIPVAVGDDALADRWGGIRAVVIFDGQGKQIFRLGGGGQADVGRFFSTQRRLTGVIDGLS